MKQQLVIVFGLVLFILSSTNTPLHAQYFGKNKPIYKNFKYNVYQTPNFEIYNYLKNDSLLNKLSFSAEKWYDRHYQVFRDS
ncbi:MAG: hypothetical protein AB7S54_12150, partial [Bacteroidales bacterium]